MSITVKAREISVKGPKGSLVRSFKHIAVDFTLDEAAKSLKCEVWFGNRETIAAIRFIEDLEFRSQNYYHNFKILKPGLFARTSRT